VETTRSWARCMGAFVLAVACAGAADADRLDTIERVKGSIVAIGTMEPTRAPPFQFRGSGFAVGDGTLIVTNAHVLPALLDASKFETLAILVPGRVKDGTDTVQVRQLKPLAVDPGSDLAVLQVSGAPLPSLKVREGGSVREGQEILFTGYPIGAVLGPYPATHRGIISAVTPIAIPQSKAGDLDARTIRRLSTGAFPVYQLDATAYPGSSGSPVYDPETGEVLGVVNMVFVKGTKEAVLTEPSGITYAIPSSHLQDLLKKAR
jgi:S1-C subfamily serine protease